MIQTPSFSHFGLAVIEIEAEAVRQLANRFGTLFDQACSLLMACQGRIIVTGMGKSGHIARKIAATLASTGSPAFFVHPGEASHGDSGMITTQDIVIALSNSGETDELLALLPVLKRLNIPLITLTGNATSSLAQHAKVNLDVSVSTEACPLGLAPTASTTAALVMGDALAIALLQARGFSTEDFALSHPGGRLGRRLLLRVSDIMRTGDAIPIVKHNTLLIEALVEMTHKRMGFTLIADDQGNILGIFTDGDLRRILESNLNLNITQVAKVMNHQFKTISAEALAAEALQLMETHRISALVVEQNQQMIGVIHMHDLIRARVI